MTRGLYGTLAVSLIVLAAMAITSTPALGQASPNHEGTATLTAPTATCPGFAAGSLSFDSVVLTYTLIRTWNEPDNPYGEIRYMYRWSGTTTTGGYTYTLRATTHFAGDQLYAGNYAPSTGQFTIRRSDGWTLIGKALVEFEGLVGQFLLTWQEAPHCR